MHGTNIVGVQFRRAGKIYDFAAGELELAVGDHVIVDSERGPSLAQVVAIRYHNPVERLEKKLKPILRRASSRELAKPSRLSEDEVSDFTAKQVGKLKLNMRILKSEVQFGGNKVIVYFTAPGRVDFRELVKDLAGGLRTRVELKQVGARDETKLLGGMGICGREYCCSSFLREFVPVSIRMAKNQNLALNPSKVSGGCGRLLCCLTYENDTYTHLRQVLPPKGTLVEALSLGVSGRVIKSDLLNQTVVIEDGSGQTMTCKVNDLKIIDKQHASYDELGDEDLAGLDDTADEWAETLDLESLTKHLDEKAPSNAAGRGQGSRPSQQQQRGGRPGGRPSNQGRSSEGGGGGRQPNDRVAEQGSSTGADGARSPGHRGGHPAGKPNRQGSGGGQGSSGQGQGQNQGGRGRDRRRKNPGPGRGEDPQGGGQNRSGGRDRGGRGQANPQQNNNQHNNNQQGNQPDNQGNQNPSGFSRGKRPPPKDPTSNN